MLRRPSLAICPSTAGITPAGPFLIDLCLAGAAETHHGMCIVLHFHDCGSYWWLHRQEVSLAGCLRALPSHPRAGYQACQSQLP
jgi:hypothetical protein